LDVFNDLEVNVKVVDIEYERLANREHPNVYGYSFLIHEIHRHLDKGERRDMAIKLAVEKCIEKGLLKEYIENTGLEGVLAMLNYEYSHEGEIEYTAKINREEGIAAGKAEGKAEIMRNMRDSGFSEEDIAKAMKPSLLHEETSAYETTSS